MTSCATLWTNLSVQHVVRGNEIHFALHLYVCASASTAELLSGGWETDETSAGGGEEKRLFSAELSMRKSNTLQCPGASEASWPGTGSV